MHVIDGLQGVGPAVDHRAVTALGDPKLFGQVLGYQVHAAKRLDIVFGDVGGRGDVATGDDEEVNRCLWLDILKGDHVFVGIHHFGRNLASRDAAEKAIVRGHAECYPPLAFIVVGHARTALAVRVKLTFDARDGVPSHTRKNRALIR